MDSNKANKPTLIVPICGIFLKKNPIVLQLESYHYNVLIVEEDCIYPPINPIYMKIRMDIKELEKELKRYVRVQCQRSIKKNKDVLII